MKRVVVWSLVMCAPMLLQAQASRTDFARGAEIRTEQGGSLFRVLLPDDVYDTSTRGDLGDIRVLNAAGETVPHTLREVPRPGVREAEWRAVPSFPMTETQSGIAARTHVRVGADGAVLDVTNDKAPGRATTAYLIDASAIDEPVARIALTWEAAPGTAFLVPVSVVASDDLSHWRTVVSASALAQLQRDAYTLTQNEIELTGAGDRAKYFRVTWPKELSAVVLKSVRVRPPSSIVERETHWRMLSAERVEPAAMAHYQTRAYLPIEYVNLEFADAPVDELLATLDSGERAKQVREATLGSSQTLGGADALKPAPAPIPWKRVVLWGVLIVVVAALALMAARLFKETKQEA